MKITIESPIEDIRAEKARLTKRINELEKIEKAQKDAKRIERAKIFMNLLDELYEGDAVVFKDKDGVSFYLDNIEIDSFTGNVIVLLNWD